MVNYIETDKDILEWLQKKLQTEYPGDCISLLRGLKELNEKNTTLILEKHESVLQNTSVKAGELLIDLRRRTVIKNGEDIFLTPKEFDILYFLYENRGEVFNKEQIYNAVWKEDYLLSESNIMAFIRKLRKKIETEPDSPVYILTIWGVGYKFNDKI